MSLRARLADRIRASGPITFAAFMDAVLYDASDGFFTRATAGAAGHFVTSPHVSPVFGALVCAQVLDCWEALGEPAAFTVLEVGAGDGALARQILDTALAHPPLARSIRYLAVERAPAARAALAGAGIEVLDSVDAAAPVQGCVLANEVFDNVPFHLLRARSDGTVVEVLVGLDEGRLVEVEDAPTPEALAALAAPLRPGEERPVSPAALTLVRAIAGALERGYAFVVDYGFAPGEGPQPVHGYRAHRLVADVLADPGESDVTGPVDFGALAAEGARARLEVSGPVTQRDALRALGFDAAVGSIRADQRAAEAGDAWAAALRAYGARGEAAMLVDPDGLGAHRVLALATPGLAPPRATRLAGAWRSR